MIKIESVYKGIKCVITNGSEISDETLDLIKELSKKYRIICFLDPDFPGERIRSKIVSVVPNALHAYIKKELCISKTGKKVGVEHAKKEDIKKVLDPILTKNFTNNNLLTTFDLFNLGIVGNKNLRDFISSYYNVGRPNNKTLLNRLNMLDISYVELKGIVEEFYAK